jgi:glycosyltransferase involved in cell wall biosynthesis
MNNTNPAQGRTWTPTISLCMIVKNEEKFLPACLESVKDHVDEIIIVDTGSTDSTVQIAKRYDAKIYHHAWENSFSKSRNYSLKYATCEWILVLDADEEVDKQDAHKLKEVIKNPIEYKTTHRANAIYLQVVDKTPRGDSRSIMNSIRLFKNNLGFHYEGIVHNELNDSGFVKKAANIKIYHYGYNLDDERMKKKFIRTSTLLREQIKSDPKNPIPHHYLTLAYLGRKRFDECLPEALEAIRLFEQQNSNSQVKLLTYYAASASFYHKKDLVNAEIYALKAIDFYADYMDAYSILSSIYFQRKEYSKCTEVTKKYLKLLKSIESDTTTALSMPYLTIHRAWMAHSRMAIIYYEHGNEHEGIQSLNNAISCVDNKWKPYLAAGEYFLEQKNLKLAEEFLKNGLHNSPDNKELLLNLGRLYYLKNDIEMTETLYKKALGIDADYVEALKGMGTLYLDMKKFEEARILLYKTLRKVQDVEVYNNLGCLEDKEGLYERARFFFEKALELEPERQEIMNNLKSVQMKLTRADGNTPFPSVPKGETRLSSVKQESGFAGSISLCMIVKNEEKFLPTCLESIKNRVDEIIIVDTGSTDSTVEIAKRYNAKIYHHAWENSFSKARNYSLKYATCEWILILDADEEVDREDAHKLKKVIKDNSINLIYLPVISKPVGGKNISISTSERLFKNHLGFHYEGIVHNVLKHSGLAKKADIKIYHYGYNQGDEQMEKKFIRTSILLREQIKNDPKNPIPHHYLAISYLDRQKNDECIREALEAIRLFEQQKSNVQPQLLTYYTASVAFYRKKDLTNAEAYALKAIDFYADYVDAYCMLSSIYLMRKEHDKCIEATSRFLKLLKSIESNPTKALVIPYNNLQHDWLAHSRMAIVYYEQGKELEGIQSLNNAISCTDNKWEPYLVVGKYFLEQGNLKLAEKFFRDGLRSDPNNRGIQYYIAETYEKSGEPDKALTHFKKILEYYPGETFAQYRAGLLLLKKNQFSEAINMFQKVANEDQQNIDALFNLGIALEGIGKTAQAKDTYNKTLKAKPENTEALVRLGSLYLGESNYIKAKECFLNTLKLEKYVLEANLALSKIYISLNDPEGCVMSCDQLLKYLNLPRNIIIDNIYDLSKLYVDIGIILMKQRKELLANFSFEIAALLNPGYPSEAPRLQTEASSK